MALHLDGAERIFLSPKLEGNMPLRSDSRPWAQPLSPAEKSRVWRTLKWLFVVGALLGLWALVHFLMK